MKKIILLIIISAFILKAEEARFYHYIFTNDELHFNSLNNSNITKFLETELSDQQLMALYNINTSERFMNDVLLKTEFRVEDYKSANQRYILVNDSIKYNNANCMVYFDYHANILFYYDFENFTILKEIPFLYIREVYYNKKYFTVFTDKYQFDTFELSTGKQVSSILPFAIITGDVLVLDDKLVLTKHDGITVYDILTGKKIWKNNELLVYKNGLFQFDLEHFFFIYDNNISLINVDNGEIVKKLKFSSKSDNVLFSFNNAEAVYISKNRIEYENILNDENYSIEIPKIIEYYPFLIEDRTLYLLKKNEIFTLCLSESNKKIKFYKRIEDKVDENQQDITKGRNVNPYFNLEYLQKILKYPNSLSRKGVSVKLELRVYLSKDGFPIMIYLNSYQSNHTHYVKEFFYEASKAILKTRFDPAIVNNEKIRCYLLIPIRFE